MNSCFEFDFWTTWKIYNVLSELLNIHITYGWFSQKIVCMRVYVRLVYYRCSYFNVSYFICNIVNGVPLYVFMSLYDMHFDYLLSFTVFQSFFIDLKSFCWRAKHFVCTKRVVMVLGLNIVNRPVWLSPYIYIFYSAFGYKCSTNLYAKSKWTHFLAFMHRCWYKHGHDTSLYPYRTCTHTLSFDCYNYGRYIYYTQPAKRWTDTLTRKLMIKRMNKKNNTIHKITCWKQWHQKCSLHQTEILLIHRIYDQQQQNLQHRIKD